MGKDVKIFIGLIALTFALIVGFANLQSKGEETTGNMAVDILDIKTSPETYDLGNVVINEGLVTREYEVVNTSEQPVKLQKIATSCMCTQAMVEVAGEKTRFFGMEHPTDKNPRVNLEISPGQTAKVIVNFDPAAHGPQGVGPFDRVVTLTFSEPAGVKNLTFSGTVVNQL